MNLPEIISDNIERIEFGVGVREKKGAVPHFVKVPVDREVKDALNEMLINTKNKMHKALSNGKHVQYEPSEKYSEKEYVYLPTSSNLVGLINDLRTALFTVRADAMTRPEIIFSYFAVFHLVDGKKVIAVRRALPFKAIQEKTLLKFVSDALAIVKDKVFKLDSDFDFIADSENVHILRPAGFESICELDKVIKDTVPENAKKMEKDIGGFVNIDNVASYATKHIRAARSMASICSQGYAKNIDMGSLERLCQETNVEIQKKNEIIHISEGSELGFLDVLDRRRYEVKLTTGDAEIFKAQSRRKI